MLICWPARNEVQGTQGHKRRFIHTSVEGTFSVMVCACVCVSEFVQQSTPQVVFIFDKKTRASFQAPAKPLFIYRASPLCVQSKVERAPLPRSNE